MFAKTTVPVGEASIDQSASFPKLMFDKVWKVRIPSAIMMLWVNRGGWRNKDFVAGTVGDKLGVPLKEELIVSNGWKIAKKMLLVFGSIEGTVKGNQVQGLVHAKHGQGNRVIQNLPMMMFGSNPG